MRALARAPKLGVLTLAGVLEQAGLRPRIFDLDDAYADYLAEACHWGLEGFPAWVAPRILSSDACIFGFSSLCSSYPVSIRIAEHVKREAPHCTILFGGPQASAVDLPTLSAFPFVDFVLRGEADLSLPLFLDQWSGERRFLDVPGLTWRSPSGPRRNQDAPVIDNLDDLPLPAFHLSGSLKHADYAFLEVGRGCPFSCAFCSTSDFFRRRFRVKSPARMLADMRLVASRYGFRSFDLIHDIFTADRRKVVAFCDAMIESKEGFSWSCSARTDYVDEGLLELMARAGCDGIFFGVETGSKRMQRIIDKHLDPAQARTAVETAERLGMSTTVSTIAGFPEENEDDLRQTLDINMHSLRHPHSVPQLNLLAPLAGTRIYSQYKDRMVLEDLGSYLSYPGRSQSCADRDLVRRHPAIFPNFYLLPTPALDRSSLMELGPQDAALAVGRARPARSGHSGFLSRLAPAPPGAPPGPERQQPSPLLHPRHLEKRTGRVLARTHGGVRRCRRRSSGRIRGNPGPDGCPRACPAQRTSGCRPDYFYRHSSPRGRRSRGRARL